MTRTIGIVVFPDFQLLDAAGPTAAFEIAARLAPEAPGYAVVALSAEGGMVRSSAGIAVETAAFAEAPACDTLLVAGGEGTRACRLDAAVPAFLAARAPATRRLASVCTGAFVLAAAGLLEGRQATTHWRQAARLRREFPDVRVLDDRIWVRDGEVWSSAGISAGIDLALALVADDLGEETARRTARELVVYHRRPGGQSQFSSLLEQSRPDGRFAPLLSWAREHLDEPLTVEQLAERAAMSPRNFARRFAAEVGRPPAKAVEQLRLEAARGLIEGSGEPLERIAERVGFREIERMRRAFVRTFGHPPQALRRAARGQAAL